MVEKFEEEKKAKNKENIENLQTLVKELSYIEVSSCEKQKKNPQKTKRKSTKIAR
jgi:hypothetical protein